MSPISYRSFLDDPLRGVRFLRRCSRAIVPAVGLGLVVLYAISFDLSWGQALVIVLTLLVPAIVGLEIAFIYIARVVRSTVCPVKMVVEMGPLEGFRQACERSAGMVKELLEAEAAVVAWLNEELEELEPVAAVGFPERWLKLAPRVSLQEGSFRDVVHDGQIVLQPADDGEPWFSPFGDSYLVAYVPLVSLDKGIGVLGVLGDSETANLHDRRLLGAIGVAIGPALDNARLYEGEKKRAEKLQQLAQMRSDFLITVSHELRTPLTSIKTSAEMLQEEDRAPADSPRGRLIANIVRGAQRLSTLIADLVSMARLDSSQQQLNLEPVGTGEMVSATCTLLYPLIQAKGQTLDLHFGTPGPKVMVERRRFEQILVNLVANANRFTPSGGRITVEVREEGNDVVIAVSDTGPGIAEEEREAIFQPFYRGKGASQRSASGMGMGLAIAKSLTELHGGRIWVESSEGGSSFCLAVQRAEEPAAEPASAWTK